MISCQFFYWHQSSHEPFFSAPSLILIPPKTCHLCCTEPWRRQKAAWMLPLISVRSPSHLLFHYLSYDPSCKRAVMPAGASWCSYDAGTKGFTRSTCWEESRRVETSCAQTFLYLFFLLLHRLFWGHHSACCSVHSFQTYLAEMPSKVKKEERAGIEKGSVKVAKDLPWRHDSMKTRGSWSVSIQAASGTVGKCQFMGWKSPWADGLAGSLTHPPTDRWPAIWSQQMVENRWDPWCGAALVFFGISSWLQTPEGSDTRRWEIAVRAVGTVHWFLRLNE